MKNGKNPLNIFHRASKLVSVKDLIFIAVAVAIIVVFLSIDVSAGIK